MALIRCPECGREVSDKAPACIHCGYPLQRVEQDPNQLYKVILTELGNNQPETVKIVREVTYLGLKEAIGFVQSLPRDVAKGLYLEDAKRLESSLAELNNKVVVEEDNASIIRNDIYGRRV